MTSTEEAVDVLRRAGCGESAELLAAQRDEAGRRLAIFTSHATMQVFRPRTRGEQKVKVAGLVAIAKAAELLGVALDGSDEDLPLPGEGAWLQRRDDQRIGIVVYVATKDSLHKFPMYEGDREVQLEPGRSIVSSAAGFWKRWKPVDLAALALAVVAEVLGTEE